MHPDMMAASEAAVTDGRLTREQADYLLAFMANPQAFSIGNLLNVILPILAVLFPQFASIIALITTFFHPTPTPTPAPTPTPSPTPAPGNIFTQIWAFIQSLFNGGKTPVPGPSPAPAPAPIGIVPPVPVP